MLRLVYWDSGTGSTTKVSPSILRTRTRVPLGIFLSLRASQISPWTKIFPCGSRLVCAVPIESIIPWSPVTIFWRRDERKPQKDQSDRRQRNCHAQRCYQPDAGARPGRIDENQRTDDHGHDPAAGQHSVRRHLGFHDKQNERQQDEKYTSPVDWQQVKCKKGQDE